MLWFRIALVPAKESHNTLIINSNPGGAGDDFIVVAKAVRVREQKNYKRSNLYSVKWTPSLVCRQGMSDGMLTDGTFWATLRHNIACETRQVIKIGRVVPLSPSYTSLQMKQHLVVLWVGDIV